MFKDQNYVLLSGLLLLLGYKNLPLANRENGERKIINKGK